ncbi:MAG: acyl-ACP--UDP-N-acetylglucosamine O-acyltransferase [Thermodesulfovibrionales bacterium]|nr:acyl-ACP--UDP-N-acetylglucosamine O-acyltransferase [Thermodesulfovibrionales bacterium]
MPTIIHQSSIVSPNAQISDGVFIGPFCTISDEAVIGKNTRLISHVVIDGKVEIGEDNQIYPFVSIGLPPQDIKYKGEDASVRIGNKNIFRENMTVHRASVSGDRITEIGHNNFFMAYTHIAHDCKIGNNTILVNGATLGGHVVVEDFVVIGGLTPVHQFCRIGTHAMLGGGSSIVNDIPPYVIAAGYRGQLYGLNLVGLRRRGFSKETINILKKAYMIIFQEHHLLKDAINKVINEVPQIEEVKRLISFIETSKRGICRKLAPEPDEE